MANLLYNLAQPFSDTKQYTQGVIVIYNDRMYEMTADEYTPGPFDPEKFTERFLSEMISGKLNSNLGAKLLWENPNPTSGFVKQDIIISDLSKYEYAIIEAKEQCTLDYMHCRLLIKKSETLFFGSCLNLAENSIRAVYFNDTTLEFADASIENGITNNNVCIPIKIYGVNLSFN